MGLGRIGTDSVCMMRKFRWLFKIDDLIGDGVNALPPDKGARPSLNFKEIEAQHLNETIYFAGKPDWKPITLTLFDLKGNNNPIFKWLKEQYDPCNNAGTWKVPDKWKKKATLEMYDGCGEVMESWTFENIWPNNIEWGDLDMSNNDYVTVELTLRYDRAYTNDC